MDENTKSCASSTYIKTTVLKVKNNFYLPCEFKDFTGNYWIPAEEMVNIRNVANFRFPISVFRHIEIQISKNHTAESLKNKCYFL